MDFVFGPEFQAELAALDAALAPDVESQKRRIAAEVDQLRLRHRVAQEQHKPEIQGRIGRMIELREATLRLLDSYVSQVKAPAAAPVSVPSMSPRPVVATTEPVRPIMVPGITPVGGKQRADRVPPAPPSLPLSPAARAAEAAPVQPAAVTPPPARAPINSKAAVRAGQQFMARERQFLEVTQWDRVREAELKALVCEGRAVLEMQLQADLDPHLIRDSISLLQERFNDATEDQRFFAFNMQRHHSEEIWKNLSDAFANLAVAQQCLDWLDAQESDPDDIEELVSTVGAAEAWIHRLNEDRGLEFVDEQQREIHRRVEEIAQEREFYVRWWNHSDPKVTTDLIAKEAGKLDSRFKNAELRHEGRIKKTRSITALTGLVKSLDDDGDLEQTLVPAILRCLDAGVAPSKKELVEACLPYTAFLQDLENPQLRRLVEALRKEHLMLTRKNQVEPMDLVEEEPEESAMLQEVREHLRGKTVLFVGGRCLPKKQAEIQEALGVELVWPDAEPDTLINQFAAPTFKADVVCYLIRWSRHSYKLVLDQAKRLGKETVTIKAGVGLNRFVHDVHHQLIEKRPTMSTAR